MPRLEQAIRDYRKTEDVVSARLKRTREEAQRDLDLASDVVAASRKLSHALGRLLGTKRQIGMYTRMGDLGRGFSVRREHLESLLDRVRQTERWAQQICDAKKRASGRSPGPDVHVRTALARFVGEQLKRTGVTLTKSERGDFARVLSAVHEAVFSQPPASCYRDVAQAVERIDGGTTRSAKRNL
jgi:hypothetical protein